MKNFVFVKPHIENAPGTYQQKTGLIIPNMKDCYTYGIQFVFTNPFYNTGSEAYSNTENDKIINNFKTEYNSILLKDFSLRYQEKSRPVIKKQLSILSK